jgi:hypothetical protein
VKADALRPFFISNSFPESMLPCLKRLTPSFPPDIVRLNALTLIWLLCNLYGNHVISVVQGARVRLVDDGFAKVCNAVNDASVLVRTRSCTLLGNIRNVRANYLTQTLSKELQLASASEEASSSASGSRRGGRRRRKGAARVIKSDKAGTGKEPLDPSSSPPSSQTGRKIENLFSLSFPPFCFLPSFLALLLLPCSLKILSNAAKVIPTPETDLELDVTLSVGLNDWSFSDSSACGAFVQGLEGKVDLSLHFSFVPPTSLLFQLHFLSFPFLPSFLIPFSRSFLLLSR